MQRGGRPRVLAVRKPGSMPDRKVTNAKGGKQVDKRLQSPPEIGAGFDQVTGAVDSVLTTRHSVRRFLPEPVPPKVIRDILEVAACTPSGVNAQPWNVHVITGNALERFSAALVSWFESGKTNDKDPLFPVYPEKWESPFNERRKKLGVALYGLLGIAKGDREAMMRQAGRNYRFFDAPVGLIFTVHESMAKSALLDCGMFMQSIMIAARARGLDTCSQAAFIHYHKRVSELLGITSDHYVICGMSLGYADPDAPENLLETDRAAPDEFAVFHDD